MTLLTILSPDGTTLPATLPGVDDVAALLRARTLDDNGDELGTFNDNTRPTGQAVGNLIDQAADDLAIRVGAAIPFELELRAKTLVAKRAAADIELSYFPQQIDSDQSAYRQLIADYLNGVDSLQKAVRRESGFTSIALTTPVAQSSALLASLDLLP
jgi:hypothetical protein